MFTKEILPILEDHCYDCHGDGEKKGKIAFDTFGSTAALMDQTDLWVHALKNVRSGLMPPAKEERLTSKELSTLAEWIKRGPAQARSSISRSRPVPSRCTG